MKNWFIISSSGSRFGLKKIGVHFWGLLFIGVWSGSEKLFSPNCQAYLDLTNLPETWMALHRRSLTHKMTCGLIMQPTGCWRFDLSALSEFSSLLCLHLICGLYLFIYLFSFDRRSNVEKKQFTVTPDFVSNAGLFIFPNNVKWHLSNRWLRTWVDCADLSERSGWGRWRWSWKVCCNQTWRDQQRQLTHFF